MNEKAPLLQTLTAGDLIALILVVGIIILDSLKVENDLTQPIVLIIGFYFGDRANRNGKNDY